MILERCGGVFGRAWRFWDLLEPEKLLGYDVIELQHAAGTDEAPVPRRSAARPGGLQPRAPRMQDPKRSRGGGQAEIQVGLVPVPKAPKHRISAQVLP